MTELSLYKFITENNVEWHYDTESDDVIIFPYVFQMESFSKLLSNTVFDDEGINCFLKDGYFAIYMKDICEYHDVDFKKVFVEE